jgi:FAD binding domain
VIDLSKMSRVDVDPGKRVARAAAGALVRDLDQATQRYGLATTSGGCPTVGIAGLTLGGGEGFLMSKYGAACDNLLSAQLVTVEGRQVEASQSSNPDLFWAMRRLLRRLQQRPTMLGQTPGYSSYQSTASSRVSELATPRLPCGSRVTNWISWAVGTHPRRKRARCNGSKLSKANCSL